MHKIGTDLHILGIAPVDIAAGCLELGTEILLPGQAILTMPTRGGDPCHSHALADLECRSLPV
jgi:hypothetical protein